MAKYQIRKILVPMNGSKNSFRGLDTAIYLARQCSVTLTGLFVMPIYPRSFMPITYDKKYLTKATNEFMGNAKKLAAQNGIVFVGKSIIGNESIEIADFAAKNKFDIIVIGARGPGSVKGGISWQYITCSCTQINIPVLVVK